MLTVVVMLYNLGLGIGLSLWYFIVIISVNIPYSIRRIALRTCADRLCSEIQSRRLEEGSSELFYLVIQIVNRIN